MSALQPTNPTAHQYIEAVERNPDLMPTTKRQYRLAVERALRDGVDLTDAVALRDYAAQQSTSTALYLRGAIRCWADRLQLAIESQVQPSPESVAQAQAAIMRLNALARAIRTKQPKGVRAHIWLSHYETAWLLKIPNAAEPAGLRDKVCLALLVGAGLRRSEAAQITWSQFKRQGDRYVLEVLGKGKKHRVVPISAEMSDLLRHWQAKSATTGLVLRRFYKGNTLGKSLGLTAIYNIVQYYGNLLGHENLQPHDLRRTYAQIGFDNNIPLTQISRLLGHSSLGVTQRYLNIELDLDETISDFVPFG